MFAKDFFKAQFKSCQNQLGKELAAILASSVHNADVVSERLQHELERQLKSLPPTCSELEKNIYINSVLLLFK